MFTIQIYLFKGIHTTFMFVLVKHMLLFRVFWVCLSLCKYRYNSISYSRIPVLVLKSFVAGRHSACACQIYFHFQMNVTWKYVKSRCVCEYSIDVPSCIEHITDCLKFTFFFVSFPCCSCSLPGCPYTSPHWNQLEGNYKCQ